VSTSPSEWYVYPHTVEGLFFKALKPKIGPALAERLKACGIDLAGKPREVQHENWKKALTLVATELFEGTLDERYRQLGRSVLLRYEETLMGKTVVGLMRMLGPRRVLVRINATLRSGNNYIEASLSELSPQAFEGEVNECNGNPNYIAGVIEQGLIIAGAKDQKVTIKDFDGHRAKFLIEWS
jgi:uncharacterized protein (TIGR02265 family)